MGIQTRRRNANAPHPTPPQWHRASHRILQTHSVPSQMLLMGSLALYWLPPCNKCPVISSIPSLPRKVLAFLPVSNLNASRKWRTSLPHKIVLRKCNELFFPKHLKQLGALDPTGPLSYSNILPGGNGWVEWVSSQELRLHKSTCYDLNSSIS